MRFFLLIAHFPAVSVDCCYSGLNRGVFIVVRLVGGDSDSLENDTKSQIMENQVSRFPGFEEWTDH